MIKFEETSSEFSKDSIEKLKGFKEIKPEKIFQKEVADDFWNDVFENEMNESYTLDVLFSNIFDYSEDDFDNDFDNDFEISDDITETIDKIQGVEWNNLEETEKFDLVEDLSNKIGEKLGLDSQPEIIYYDGSDGDCGAYCFNRNELEINHNLLNDPSELVDTVAHELRHAYQHQRAENPVTRLDVLYGINFDNYVIPEIVDGNYVYFNEYQNQLVEAEARSFAKQFTNREDG